MSVSPTGHGAVQAWRALPSPDRLAVLAYLTAGNASQQMHFFNVRTDSMPFAQRDVHGLLGQRAIGPVRPIMTTNELRAVLDGSVTSTELLSAGAGTTIRASVTADGAVPQLQGEGAIEGTYRSYQVREPHHHTTSLNQSVPDAMHRISRCQVKFVSSHGLGAFAYSRFKCAAPPVESREWV